MKLTPNENQDKCTCDRLKLNTQKRCTVCEETRARNIIKLEEQLLKKVAGRRGTETEVQWLKAQIEKLKATTSLNATAKKNSTSAMPPP